MSAPPPVPAVPPQLAFPIAAPWLSRASNEPATARVRLIAGQEALRQGDAIKARTLLNEALLAGLQGEEALAVMDQLQELAARTLFSRRDEGDDPLVAWHTVQSGDRIRLIARRYRISEALIAHMNGLRDPGRVREGTRLKLLRGPFHADISKNEHRVYLYLQDLFVRAMPAALGVEGSTPTGLWRVANSLQNPGWTDPRTGKRWHADDPLNPIGEYWIGLEGIEGNAVGQKGYGIHGTIEPETIGQDVSLGCVRLGDEDIALTYRCLVPEHSYVRIRP